MFRIPNYIAVWKNEIETSLKARLKFPKRKWIDTSLFSNRRPETSLYKELHLFTRAVRLFVNNGLIAELLAELAEEFVLHLFRYRFHEP